MSAPTYGSETLFGYFSTLCITWHFLFRNRRPEARPSTSLVLQLMDFEDALKGKGGGSIRASQSSQSSSMRSSTKKFLELDWRAKAKLALPLTIYLLVVAVVIKLLYSLLLRILEDDDDDNGELVCF